MHSCYPSSMCLFRELSRGFVFSLSFRRLWPLRYQLQWLMGVTGIRVRLCYITCNSFIKCFTFFWYEIGSNELYCCNDSSMFRSFRCRVLLQWQCNSETNLFNCCSDSFVWKLTNILIHQFCWYSVLRKKITFFSIYWNAYPVVGWQVTCSHGYTG